MFENYTQSGELEVETQPSQKPANDKRAAPRQRCFKTGQIILGDSGPTYDCTFKDLSWFGVKLEMHNFVPLPSKFRLALSYGKNTKAFYCKKIWSNGREIGVIFDHHFEKQTFRTS